MPAWIVKESRKARCNLTLRNWSVRSSNSDKEGISSLMSSYLWWMRDMFLCSHSVDKLISNIVAKLYPQGNRLKLAGEPSSYAQNRTRHCLSLPGMNPVHHTNEEESSRRFKIQKKGNQYPRKVLLRTRAWAPISRIGYRRWSICQVTQASALLPWRVSRASDRLSQYHLRVKLSNNKRWP